MEKTMEPVATKANAPVELGHKVFLAWLGAVAMTQDEIGRLVKQAEERGEIVQRESRKQIDKAMEIRQQRMKSTKSEVDHQIDVLLNRLGVPTKAELEKMDLPTRADIEALSEKVAALSKKVDQLRKAEEPPAPPRKAVEDKKPEPVKA